MSKGLSRQHKYSRLLDRGAGEPQTGHQRISVDRKNGRETQRPSTRG